MSSEQHFDKKTLELEWANSAVNTLLLPPLQKLWGSLRSTLRTSASFKRAFVVWQLAEDGPKALYTLSPLDFGATFQGGLRLVLSTPNGPLTVGHVPVKLPDVDVFVWLPQFSELRWSPYDYTDPTAGRQLTVPVCFKVASNLIKYPTIGDVYVSTATQLRQHFPQHKY